MVKISNFKGSQSFNFKGIAKHNSREGMDKNDLLGTQMWYKHIYIVQLCLQSEQMVVEL